MAQVPLAALKGIGQTEPRLQLPIERAGGLLGVTTVPAVDTVDHRSPIRLEPEQRADALHDLQDTNSPAGKTDGADVVNIPATTYFPRGLPPEYLRRWRA